MVMPVSNFLAERVSLFRYKEEAERQCILAERNFEITGMLERFTSELQLSSYRPLPPVTLSETLPRHDRFLAPVISSESLPQYNNFPDDRPPALTTDALHLSHNRGAIDRTPQQRTELGERESREQTQPQNEAKVAEPTRPQNKRNAEDLSRLVTRLQNAPRPQGDSDSVKWNLFDEDFGKNWIPFVGFHASPDVDREGFPTCQICPEESKKIPTTVTWPDHVMSLSHLTSTNKSAVNPTAETDPRAHFICLLCRSIISGSKNRDPHLEGMRHKRKYADRPEGVEACIGRYSEEAPYVIYKLIETGAISLYHPAAVDYISQHQQAFGDLLEKRLSEDRH